MPPRPKPIACILLAAWCCLDVSGCATCTYKTESQKEQDAFAKAQREKLSLGEKAEEVFLWLGECFLGSLCYNQVSSK